MALGKLPKSNRGPWAALPHPGLWGNAGQDLKGNSGEGQIPVPRTEQPFWLNAQDRCFDVSGPSIWRVVTVLKLALEERTRPCPEAEALNASHAPGPRSLGSRESYGWRHRGHEAPVLLRRPSLATGVSPSPGDGCVRCPRGEERRQSLDEWQRQV